MGRDLAAAAAKQDVGGEFFPITGESAGCAEKKPCVWQKSGRKREDQGICREFAHDSGNLPVKGGNSPTIAGNELKSVSNVRKRSRHTQNASERLQNAQKRAIRAL
jgi:hypothetical protein